MNGGNVIGGPNKVLGPCPKEGCNGALMTFDAPWFSAKPKPAQCSVCGHIPPPPDKEGVIYIRW